MSNRQIRERNYRLFFINIKIRPTPTKEDSYSNLLKRAYKLKMPICVRGQECIVIKSLDEVDCRVKVDRMTKVIYGKFAKYTRIDGKDWFDLNTMDKAEDVEIPNDVFPNLKESDFFFLPEAHRLAFVGGNGFTTNNVTKYLFLLLEQAKNAGEEIEVNIITDVVQIEQILKANEISKLSVSLSYSNADETSVAAGVLDNLIKESKASSFRNELSGRIDPNSDLVKAFLELSSNNGYAEAKIKNVGDTKFRTIKTTNYPKAEDIKSEDTTLLQKVASYIIGNWRKRDE